MRRRRPVRPLVVLALMAALLVSTVFFSSAATLGGLGSDHLGASTSNTQHITGAQLEWNLDADAAARPRSVRLTADAGETFGTADTVDITVAGPGSDTCSSTATVAQPVTALDLTLSTCAFSLWEVDGVAVSISGASGGTILWSNLGGLRGTLSALDGPVVRPEVDAATSYTTTRDAGTEVLTTVRLEVRDATVEQLTGGRLLTALSNEAGESTPLVGVVGTRGDNQGIWAEADPTTSAPVIVADLAVLSGGAAPSLADVARYRMVLLQAQRLGAGQVPADQYAITTAGAAVESSGGGGDVDVSSAVEPVGLDDRLKFKGRFTQEQDETTLRFCYEFEVRNTSKEPVEWQVSFDTTQPPMWGLDPTVVNGNGVGTLNSMWNFETRSYQRGTGLWTVGGVSWNKVLAPKQSRTVGYCARPEIPAVDASTFDEPTVSVVGKNKNYVEFRVKVKSSSEYLVPWEAEVDFADHVCPASIGSSLRGQNAVLTHIEGTRYRVRGTDNTYRFVSKKNKQDYVFAAYRPLSDPFDPACR